MKIKFYQDGGAMPPEAGAPAPAPAPEAEAGASPAGAPPEGGQDPLMQIAQMFAQGLQAQDCKALAQGAQMFLELVAQSQGGGAGQPPPEEPTVMKKGGKFILKKKGEKPLDKPAEKNSKVEMAKKGTKKC